MERKMSLNMNEEEFDYVFKAVTKYRMNFVNIAAMILLFFLYTATFWVLLSLITSFLATSLLESKPELEKFIIPVLYFYGFISILLAVFLVSKMLPKKDMFRHLFQYGNVAKGKIVDVRYGNESKTTNRYVEYVFTDNYGKEHRVTQYTTSIRDIQGDIPQMNIGDVFDVYYLPDEPEKCICDYIKAAQEARCKFSTQSE